MVIALTMLGAIGAGWLIVARLWQNGELTPWERAGFVALAGVLTWLATTWALALTHTLQRPAVIVRTLVLLAIAATAIPRLSRKFREWTHLHFGGRALIVILAIAPVVVWIVFVLWRDAIVPPLSHDALSYHLPKAVMFVRAAGYRTFDNVSYVISPRASNYELLLADAIAGDGSDTYTEWPSALFYIGFIACGVAMVQRWFRPRLPALLTTALLIAGVPVLLLHTGAHKNDLLFALLAAGAILATGRWFAESDQRALVFAVASWISLVGTKTHGAVLAVSFAPLIVLPLIRPFRPKAIIAAAITACLAVMLLGGFDQLEKLRRIDRPANGAEAVGVPQYGDWENLWQAPYILLAAPFSRTPDALHVPWDPNPWFWRRYELFFSDFGMAFSFAALALPFLMVAFRRHRGSERERLAVTFAALAGFVLLLPVHFTPAGLYSIYLPRFVLFLLPVVFGWIAPVVDALTEQREAFGAACALAAAAVFSMQAVDVALHDAFVPLAYVVWARAHPGTRVIPFHPNRVESMVDRVAGPRDHIVFDAGSGAWIYPAFGTTLQRPVDFIPPGSGPPRIPDADWIIVDRFFSAVWQNPQFTSLGVAKRFMSHAVVSKEDERVINAALADPRYEPLLIDERSKQAIFRRRNGKEANVAPARDLSRP